MVRRPADALGMAVVWWAMSSPLLFALWLALSEPRHEWVATVLPLVIALGAPIAYVVSGFVGPRLGRLVSAFLAQYFRGLPRGKNPHPSAWTGSVSITPQTGSMRLSARGPNVLVWADPSGTKLPDVLAETGCNVTVAVSSSDAVDYMRREAAVLHSVVLSESMTLAAEKVLQVAREVVGPRRIFIVDVHVPNISGQDLVKLLKDDDLRIVTPEALVEHFRGWIDAKSSK